MISCASALDVGWWRVNSLIETACLICAGTGGEPPECIWTCISQAGVVKNNRDSEIAALTDAIARI